MSKLTMSLLLAAGALSSAAAFAGSGINEGPSGPLPADAPVGSLQTNHGQVLCTSAVNSDGTVAGGQATKASDTIHLGTGLYQVAFGTPCTGKLLAKNGWARWVQADTLTTGTTGPRYCTTADRAGLDNAIFVECFDNTGAFADTSFYLFIAR